MSCRGTVAHFDNLANFEDLRTRNENFPQLPLPTTTFSSSAFATDNEMATRQNLDDDNDSCVSTASWCLPVDMSGQDADQIKNERDIISQKIKELTHRRPQLATLDQNDDDNANLIADWDFERTNVISAVNEWMKMTRNTWPGNSDKELEAVTHYLKMAEKFQKRIKDIPYVADQTDPDVKEQVFLSREIMLNYPCFNSPGGITMLHDQEMN